MKVKIVPLFKVVRTPFKVAVNDTNGLMLDLHVTSSMSSPKNRKSQFKLRNLLSE